MIEKRFTQKDEDDWEIFENEEHFAFAHSGYNAKKIIERLNELYDKLDCHILLTDQERQKASNFIKGIEKENEELKIRNKGKQAFIDKQDKIIRLLYNQCKDFKEILDDSNITYPIDERLNKFFEEGVKL